MTLMRLTPEDVQRLRVLVENALAEVEAAADPHAVIRPDDGFALMNHYDWGKAFLARLVAES